MTENSDRKSFTGKQSSGVIVKSDSPLSSKKKNGTDHIGDGRARLSSTDTRNKFIRSHIEKMGPICKSIKEVAAAAAAPFLQYSAQEDIDLDKQLAKEICCDDRECMWLSSDCTTPLSVFEENRLFSPCSPSENPNPGAAKTSKNDSNRGKVVTWILNSTLSDANESCSENVEWQSCEETKSSDNSSTPPSTKPDNSSQIFYPNRMAFPASLVNLDDEDSDLISDKILELDHLQPDFPSPSYKSSLFSEVLSSSSSVSSVRDIRGENSPFSSTATEHVSEACLDDFSIEEPIFWPFELDFDWSSDQEPWIWFSTSPRKEIISPSKSVEITLHAKKFEPREGCRRRLNFSSRRAASKTRGLDRQDGSNVVLRIRTVPSRLSKSTKKNMMKIEPLEMQDDILKPKDGFESNDRPPIEKEDFVLLGELPIEKLLGLDEFDGHEGVDLGFDGDVFSLDESFC